MGEVEGGGKIKGLSVPLGVVDGVTNDGMMGL